ncbi:CAP domain-containing protein [Actinoplanes friuliensis]|jgi:uncharacterized protein YkwD|uniref:SCP domain-containing protein n=1 Tax=Actinoplanes friuliensis DSM 7358 TaxID=1246995 RepID=U5VZL5_9ACTN|nr:CAP domain-containing protein [Actinoplanes friuliensis]AGZ41081.1 hypothetical protein AFR_13975 [Actinoplanes friuliensis DSM 7358]
MMRTPVREDLERRVVAAVNEERRRARLGRLVAEPLLAVAARAHSDDMAQRGYFSHHSPEGTTAGDRVAVTGYQFAVVGENIAWGQRTAREVMTAWMNSRGHKANILDAGFTRIGVGVAADRHGSPVWTQVFAA